MQAAAVTAAVDQAKLRKGVNQVFLNISMRNQSLLHRQLGMLDSMERRTSEPEALADLFRIDHLTTRMRRHAEGLIILSGSVPGRGWRDPVPVIDVLRAAVAEVEDYVRVDVNSESDDLVAGSAVSDVIHLIAELVENATVFSPPNTRIEVRAERVGTGLVAEVEDRGLGLSAEELADINRRLASSQEFDLAHSDQLGLFVVSQLAARHDIEVSLRRSVYGGTTAVVLLPFGVIVREEEAPSGPRRPGRVDVRRRSRPDRAAPAARARTAAWTVAGAGTRSPGPSAPAAVAQTAPLAPWEIGPPPTLPTAATSVDAFGPRRRGTRETTDSWSTITPGRPRDAGRPGRAVPAGAAAAAARPRQRAPARADRVSSKGPAPRHPAATSGCPSGSRRPAWPRSCGPGRTPRARPRTRRPRSTTRSPEATRNMLSMMQQGWRRGRADDLDHPEGAPGNGTDR